MRGSDPDRGEEFFFSLLRIIPDCLWGPSSLVFSGHWGYFLAVNGPERGTDHSSQSNADIENEWSMERDSFVFLVTS